MQVLEFSPIKESRRTCGIERDGIFYFNMEKELIATLMMIVIASLFIGATLKNLEEAIERETPKKFEKHLWYVDYHWKGKLKKKKKVNRRNVLSNNFVFLV